MTLPIALAIYIVFGTLFGVATHPHRHLFSEGHTKRSASDDKDPLQSVFAWTLLCSALWPLMMLTGVFSWWVKRPR